MTTSTTPSQRTNPYAKVWECFQSATREHVLTVVHEDGVYRHLHMGKPGTRTWSWEIVTWPGHLAITGDVGDGFTFSRLHDMFDFFDESAYGDYYGDGSPFINPGYWAEKLGFAQRGAEKGYSEEVFISTVQQELADRHDEEDLDLDVDDLIDQARYHAEDERQARAWAEEHSAVLGDDFFWEVDFTAFHHHYLIACYAIVTTVAAFNSSATPSDTAGGSTRPAVR